MNCDLARNLVDDYLENRLSQRDCRCLEAHVSRCSLCAAELSRRPALERDVRQALAASALALQLSPAASTRIVQAAQSSFRRAVWLNAVMTSLRVTASVSAAALLVVGLLFLVGRIPVPLQIEPVTLLPAIRLPLSDQHPVTLSTGNQSIPRATSSTAMVSLTDEDLFVEPLNLDPSEPFTITVFLHSDMPRPLDTVHLNLDVSGPAGYYRFALVVKGPLPAHGISILRVTPDLLAASCQEQYLISPTDIFGVPGVYTVRVTLFRPLVPPE